MGLCKAVFDKKTPQKLINEENAKGNHEHDVSAFRIKHFCKLSQLLPQTSRKIQLRISAKTPSSWLTPLSVFCY